MLSLGIIVAIVALIIIIWISIELQRFRHKLYAYFLIGAIIFLALSFSLVTNKYHLDYSSPSGVLTAGKIYFTWIGSFFHNIKALTSYAIKLKWGMNESVKEVDLRDVFAKTSKN